MILVYDLKLSLPHMASLNTALLILTTDQLYRIKTFCSCSCLYGSALDPFGQHVISLQNEASDRSPIASNFEGGGGRMTGQLDSIVIRKPLIPFLSLKLLL